MNTFVRFTRSRPVVFVLKGYPRLSETFIAQEIRGLEERGLDIRIVSLRHPTDPAIHPVHREIEAPVSYLPEYLHHGPWRVLRSWWRARRQPGYRAARAMWLKDLARDRTANRVRRFGQALVLATEMGTDVAWLHAHFLHTPASVTRYAAAIRQIPFSISAHAMDVWTSPTWEIREKLADCRWLVTCTAINARHLAGLAAHPERVHLVYHGLDERRFPPRPASAMPVQDGQTGVTAPITILSVGRAVEKKGYDILLEALARLPSKPAWRFLHIGGGLLLDDLKRRATTLGIAPHVTWLGPLPQEQVITAYRTADLFVLASRVAGDGDRDGLPNVLMEAQSQGIACVATTVSAIPELIEDGTTGLLVPPGDKDALAQALSRLIRDPALRARLGAAGTQRVRESFSFQHGMAQLSHQFGMSDAMIVSCAPPSTHR